VLLESSTDPDATTNTCTPIWRPAQSAFTEANHFLTERNYGTLNRRLNLATLHPAQKLELMQMLASDDPMGFAMRYAEMKVENIHFKYETALRSAVEQQGTGRLLGGIITYPRGKFEILYRTGIKPFVDGIQKGNVDQAYQGIKTIAAFLAGIYLADESLERITGRGAYGWATAFFQYAPLAPGVSTVHEAFREFSRIQYQAAEYNWPVERQIAAYAGLTGQQIEMFVPYAEAMVTYYEVAEDTKNVTLWKIIKEEVLKDYFDKHGRPLPRAKRDTVEKWKHAFFGKIKEGEKLKKRRKPVK